MSPGFQIGAENDDVTSVSVPSSPDSTIAATRVVRGW